MPEQPSLVGRRERRPAAELDGAADVVDERSREHQVGAQPRMELRRLPAQRRDSDGVLEQAACIRVVVVGRRRMGVERRERRAPRDTVARRPGCDELADEELEEAGELVAVAADRRGQRRRVDFRRPRASERRAAAGRGTARRAPSTRTASPSSKRPSSSSTSFQTRASMWPVGSTSSSARYGAPLFVRSLRFMPHGVDVPSTTRSSVQLGDRHGPPYRGAQMRKPASSRRASATSSSTAAASFRRQPTAPARSAAVSSPARPSTMRGELASRVVASGEPVRQLPLARNEVVRERAPRAVLLDEMRVREHQPVVQRGDRPVDVLLREAGRGAQLRAGERPFRGDRRRDRLEPRPGPARRSRRRGAATSRGATHVATLARCLPDAHEAARRQLVLRVPEEPHLVAPARRTTRRRPGRPSCARATPFTCSHSDGSTTSAFGKRSARPTSSTHAAAWSSVRTMSSSVQACPWSSPSARFATTRRSPARSRRSSRRRTT